MGALHPATACLYGPALIVESFSDESTLCQTISQLVDAVDRGP
jgi:hypothetical protein